MIAEAHRQMLAHVADRLERGELVHANIQEVWRRTGSSDADEFNMRAWNCGSCACIGGWVERLYGVDLETVYQDEDALLDLFYVHGSATGTLDTITPEQAAHATRSYLATGRAYWSRILDPLAFIDAVTPEESSDG